MTPEDLVLTPQGVRFRGRLFPCSIGKRGVTADKREGDKATPAGVMRRTAVWLSIAYRLSALSIDSSDG